MDAEASGNGRIGVLPGDEVEEQVLDGGGGLVSGGASAAKWDLEIEVNREVAVAEGVLSHEGLAGGEALVGVVGDTEVGLGGFLEGVRGVVLVVGTAGAGALDGDEDEAVGGDGVNVRDVVGAGDEFGIGAEEVGDEGRRVVRRKGSEGEVGEAGGCDAVADEAVGGVEVVVAVQLLVVDVALLGLTHNLELDHHHHQTHNAQNALHPHPHLPQLLLLASASTPKS